MRANLPAALRGEEGQLYISGMPEEGESAGELGNEQAATL